MVTDADVRALLERPTADGWVLSGTGQEMPNLSRQVGGSHDELVLVVWCSAFADDVVVPTVHDHPWPVWARIVSGAMEQHRFRFAGAGETWTMQTSVDLDGSGRIRRERVEDVLLERLPLERYEAGEVYEQEPQEMHLSMPDDGTVTVCRLIIEAAPPLRQRIAWPAGTDGPPSTARRPATLAEVSRAAEVALRKWSPSKEGRN